MINHIRTKIIQKIKNDQYKRLFFHKIFLVPKIGLNTTRSEIISSSNLTILKIENFGHQRLNLFLVVSKRD